MADRPVHADSTVPPGAGGGSRQTGIGPARRDDPAELFAAARQGDRRSLARLLTMVEAGGHRGRAVAAVAYRSGAEPRTVGITGAPGAGKSTLTGRLIAAARSGGVDQLAVVAVDPTSPFSGGAVLGDRVRMQDHALDPGVYIRSMATRGHLGGLSLAVPEAVRVLGAAGMPLVLVETVGVGQVEVEVASATDTTVVVVNPRWGDAIQANKAGLMEIADIFVVNKADMPGARETVADLQQMLDLGGARHRPPRGRPHGGDVGGEGRAGGQGGETSPEGAKDRGSGPTGHGDDDPGQQPWRPPIVETIAASGDGVGDLWAAIGAHQRYLDGGGVLAERRRQRLETELQRVLDARIAAEVAELGRGDLAGVRQAVLDHDLDPYAAADRLLGEVGRRAASGRHAPLPEPPGR